MPLARLAFAARVAVAATIRRRADAASALSKTARALSSQPSSGASQSKGSLVMATPFFQFSPPVQPQKCAILLS